jgi:uncharacterized protein YjbJ (UPF0337 family)
MSDTSGFWDMVKGNWNQFKGSVREAWGDLTDDELEEIRGERDQLVGKVQAKYGKARMDAEREVDEWASRHPKSRY